VNSFRFSSETEEFHLLDSISFKRSFVAKKIAPLQLTSFCWDAVQCAPSVIFSKNSLER
jgi:hypothetical protein